MTSLSAEKRTGRDERDGAERCWIYRDAYHYPKVSFSRPDPKMYPSVEYMRVLSRDEVEKLAGGNEGIDVHQYINSLHRTIEGQIRSIRYLQEKIAQLRTTQAQVIAP